MISRHLFATFDSVKTCQSLYKTKIMNIHRWKFSDGCNFLGTQCVPVSSKRVSGSWSCIKLLNSSQHITTDPFHIIKLGWNNSANAISRLVPTHCWRSGCAVSKSGITGNKHKANQFIPNWKYFFISHYFKNCPLMLSKLTFWERF